jgi:hypothetical protein
MLRALLVTAFLILTGEAAAGSAAQQNVAARDEMLPAKTALHFHLTQPLSSDHSRTGQRFSFVLTESLLAGGTILVPKDSVGMGTLLLAGKAGTSGHEGDLTLRLDSIPTVSGRQLIFDDQRMRINGRNLKVASGVLGLIPWAGLGARFIRGSEISIDPQTPLTTVLDHNAVTLRPLPADPVSVEPSATPT